MKLEHEYNSIEEIRQEIDEVDHAIISLIRKRFSFIREIIRYKKDIDEVYAKKRYHEVISERRKFATDNNLNPDLIESIYRILMDYSIKQQLELLKNKQK